MSTSARIVWVAAVLAVLVSLWLLVTSWSNAGDAWNFLTTARDTIAPFFEGVGDWVAGITSSSGEN